MAAMTKSKWSRREQLSGGAVAVDKDADASDASNLNVEQRKGRVFQFISSLTMYLCTTIDLLFISIVVYCYLEY
jgi:hypothetical protein